MDLEQYRTQNLIVPTDPTTLVFPKIRDVKLISEISERINVWTNGQPFLIYLIHHYLNQYSAQIVSAEGSAIVDEIVSQKILKNWRQNEAANHLGAIEDAVLAHPLKDELLILYMRFLWLDTVQSAPYMPPQTQAQLQASGEKSLLLRTGLLKHREGQLKVANAIYAAVFSQDWLEEQLPGITRGVSVVSPELAVPVMPLVASNTSSNAASVFSSVFSSRLSSVFSLVFPSANRLCALLRTKKVGGKPTLGRALLASNVKLLVGLCGISLSLVTLAHAQTIRLSPIAQITVSDSARQPRMHKRNMHKQDMHKQDAESSRDLFDQGMNHAENGRWLTALQKFCQIPPNSVYFATANQQLLRWAALYPEDIRKANSGLRIKKNKPCGLAEKVLNSVEG